jgi:zinc protease
VSRRLSGPTLATPVERVRLENGLTLILEAVHDAPVVALQAWVDVGSADEDEAVAGVAHLHEHMLFKGTSSRGVGEIARAVEASGGEINAWTSYDQTVYHLVLASGELGLGIDVLADALARSSFDAAELAREIEVVVEEIKRADDVPTRRISNAIFALAYASHPYRRPVLGTEATVRGLTREKVLDFFLSHYRPERTTLVAVGDFEPAQLRSRVEAAFAGWKSGAAAKAERREEGAVREARLRALRESVKEARLALAWSIPGLRHEDTAALDALSVLLGSGDSSRLYLETRRRRELVNDVYAYAYTPRDPGLFMIGAGLKVENLLPALGSALDETYRLREHLVGEDELDKAKIVILSETAYQRETVQGEARRLGYYEVVAGEYAYEERYRAALATLTPPRLREVARRYLTAQPALAVQVPLDDGTDYERLLLPLVAERFTRAEARHKKPRRSGDLERIELDSGAVLLVRQTGAPVMAARAVALGGLRWETREGAGLGTVFASLYGLASEELGPETLAQRVALLGGSLSGFSGRNTVGLRGEFVADKALEGLDLFCDALLHPAFHAADLERERAVLLERLKSREDNPAGIAFELFLETLYPTHPYGLRIGGTEESLRQLTLSDVLAYRRCFLGPDKLVVAVVGGVDSGRVIDLLSRELEEGQREPLPQAPAPDPPPASARDARYPIDRKQTHLIVGSMGTTVHSDDRFALEVLTTILSGQSGRLFLDLRDRRSLAYALSSSSLEGLDPGHVVVHLGTSPEKVDAARAGLEWHLGELRRAPVSPEELERAQRYLIGAHAIDLQRSGARAMLNALGERFGHGYDEYLRYPAAIRAVSAARVLEAARLYLAPERLVRVVVGPAESLSAAAE